MATASHSGKATLGKSGCRRDGPGGTSSSSYVGDGTVPLSTDPDHELSFIRAVECRTNDGGMITTEEVVENIAWLVGRFVTKVLNDDGAELPPDGIVGGES